MKKEEVEDLTYLDIAYNILKKIKKGKTTKELFKEICDLLDLTETQYQELMGDFYTALNLDKRFLLIENKWELKENHSVKIIVEDELDEIDSMDPIEDIDEEDEDPIEFGDEEDDEISEDSDPIEEDEDDEDAELDKLTILEEDELDSIDL